jgi:bifunctional non-homologous end joining protein LigD
MKVNLQQLPKARLDFIKPMLAKLVDRLPVEPDWFYELKLDGYRALVLKTRGVVTLFSRRGNNLSGVFPTIAAAFSFLRDDAIVDGELVVLDKEGRPSFSALQHSRFTPEALHFYAFDLLAFQGRDLRKRRSSLVAVCWKGML